MARTRWARSGTPAALMLLFAASALADPYDTLSRLVGHSKAELIQRFGQPADMVTTIDGERLFYETLDLGRAGGVSGRDTRAGGPGGFGRFGYSFRCRTEVVIADGRVRAFNRSGNDCH